MYQFKSRKKTKIILLFVVTYFLIGMGLSTNGFIFAVILSGFLIFFGPSVMNLINTIKVSQMIKTNYSEASLSTIRAYSTNGDWGYLSLTHERLFYIPKRGSIESFFLNDIEKFGYDHIGTGDYVGGGREDAFGSTTVNMSEITVPVFFIDTETDRLSWYVKNHKKMFKELNNLIGSGSKRMKSNF